MRLSWVSHIDDVQSNNLQKDLYNNIVLRIVKGVWPLAAQLPSSRQLAQELNCSRNTVNAVYERLLVEQFVRSEEKKGYFVLAQQQLEITDVTQTSKHTKITLSKLCQRLSSVAISSQPFNQAFAPGVPDLTAFPVDKWRPISSRLQSSSKTSNWGFQDRQGYLPLREEIAKYCCQHRGLRCEAKNVVLTNGAQQGLHWLSLLLINPNQSIVVEEPGYPGARSAFLAAGANIKTVAVNEKRLDIESLPNKNSVLYCTPNHQYPLGLQYSVEQRMALVNWADQTNSFIIEDDYDGAFHFDRHPVNALQGIFPNRVLYVGSFSKQMFPALRIGYLIVPDELVAPLISIKQFSCGDLNLHHEQTTATFMAEGHFLGHLRKMRVNYQTKHQQLFDLLQTHLPSWVEIIKQQGGLHIVIRWQLTLSDSLVREQMLSAGFPCSSLSRYYYEKDKGQGLVLGFANANEQQMTAGVLALQQILKELHEPV